MELDIFSLPSVSMAELPSLPQCGGIYFIVNETQEVLYIGQSVNICGRWRSHHIHHAVCAPDNVEESSRFRAYWLVMAEESERLKLEIALIRHFSPTLNSRYNGVTLHLPIENPLPDEEREELKALIQKTGLSMAELAKSLDIDSRSLVGYCSGTRKPRHPLALKKALQLTALIQRGVITDADLPTA